MLLQYIRKNWLQAFALALTLATTTFDGHVNFGGRENFVQFAMALFAFAAPMWAWYHVTHPLSFVWNEIAFCYLPRKVVVNSSHNRDNLLLIFTVIHTIASTIYLISHYHERSLDANVLNANIGQNEASSIDLSLLPFALGFDTFRCSNRQWFQSPTTKKFKYAQIIADTVAQVHYNSSSAKNIPSQDNFAFDSNFTNCAGGFWTSAATDFGAIMLGFATIALLKASTAILCSPTTIEQEKVLNNHSKDYADSTEKRNGRMKPNKNKNGCSQRKKKNNLQQRAKQAKNQSKQSNQREKRVENRSHFSRSNAQVETGGSCYEDNFNKRAENYDSIKECTTFGTLAVWFGYVFTFGPALFCCEGSELEIRFGFFLPLAIFLLMPVVQFFYIMYECSRSYTTFMRLAGFLTLILSLMCVNAMLESPGQTLYNPYQDMHANFNNENEFRYWNHKSNIPLSESSAPGIVDRQELLGEELNPKGAQCSHGSHDTSPIAKNDYHVDDKNEKHRSKAWPREGAVEVLEIIRKRNENQKETEDNSFSPSKDERDGMGGGNDEHDHVQDHRCQKNRETNRKEETNITNNLRHINDIPFPGSGGLFLKHNVYLNEFAEMKTVSYQGSADESRKNGEKLTFRTNYPLRGTKQHTLYFI